jgi:hypothetical protein
MGFVSVAVPDSVSLLFRWGVIAHHVFRYLNGSCSCLDNAVVPLKFSRGTTANSSVHFLDPSRWRHRRSYILTRDPGASQLRRWSLDPQDLCRLQPDRRVTNRLGSATESICSCFDRRRTGEAKYPRLTRFGLETDLPLLCCGRVSPG